MYKSKSFMAFLPQTPLERNMNLHTSFPGQTHKPTRHSSFLQTNSHRCFLPPGNLGETHEAMTRAVELADENTNLTHDLHDAESTHRLLEEDALSTAQTLSHRLHHTRVRSDGERREGIKDGRERKGSGGDWWIRWWRREAHKWIGK